MRVAICIPATKKFTVALGAQATAVLNTIKEFERVHEKLEVHFVLVSEGNEKMRKLAEWYLTHLPTCKVHEIIEEKFNDDHQNYKLKAQRLLATMQTLAFNKAKSLDVDFTWSLESDVLPHSNALRVMYDVLKFDDGYYNIAFCPYVSNGSVNGNFMGGYADHKRHIFPDVYPDERRIPPKISKRMVDYNNQILKIQKHLKSKKGDMDSSLKKMRTLQSKLRFWNKYVEKRCPPKSNVFGLNSVNYRRRSWLNAAKPGLGRGDLTQSDWSGLGCNLFSRKALNYIDFAGYEGKGTSDLFLNHNRHNPNELRIGLVAHCPCDHVVRVKVLDKIDGSTKKKTFRTEYRHLFAYFEQEGECKGHLRQSEREFVEYNLLK